MIFSLQQMFTEAAGQDLTTVEVSTNTIDLGVPGTVHGAPAALARSVGEGEPVPIYVTCLGTAADVITVKVLNDAAANLGTAVTAATCPVVLDAAGYGVAQLSVLPDDLPLRYLGMSFASSADTVNVQAGIVWGRQSNKTVAGA